MISKFWGKKYEAPVNETLGRINTTMLEICKQNFV
jgi:hypothetical protein